MKRHVVYFFFCAALYSNIAGTSWAQVTPSMGSPLAKIIPPSPQAFSIGKFGSNPIGLHTGTVRYSVPLFTFDAGGGYQIPISVSYSSNGVKVDEVASRVGLQWRMDFTGVINRTIMGAPDETCIGQFRPPTHDTSQYLFFNYLRAVSESSCGVFQPDQFSYSFPGFSGKFILSGDSIVQIPYNNLTIKKSTFGFRIITPDGNQYIFGEGLSEMNREVDFVGNSGKCSAENFNAPGITSWHLRKIILANGFEIEYEYNNLSTQSNIGILQPIRYLSGSNQTNKFMQFGTDRYDYNGPPLEYWVSTCVQQLECDLILLTSIKTKNGAVRFFYSSRHDIIGEKKLDSIHLVNRANQVVNRWKLGYSYSYNNSCDFDTPLFPNETLQERYPELRKRLVLNNVTDLNQPGFPGFSFDYNNINSLPPRLSYSQDYWGYFNGQKNEYFFPAYTYGSLFNPDGVEHGGDRDGRFEFAQIGMLKRVRYPTGGYTEYFYEPSRVGYRNYRPYYDTIVVTGSVSILNPVFETDIVLNGYIGGPKIKIEPFAPRFPQTQPGAPEGLIPDTLFEVRISFPENQLQPDIVRNVTSVWDVTEINRTKLTIPTANQLKLRVMSQYDSLVNFRITLFNPRNDNDPAPFVPSGYGVKVKEVADFDNFGSKLNHRRFSYGSFWSPELADYTYSNRSPADDWLFCSAANGINWLEVSLHSSSSHSLYNNEISTISYPSVTEHFLNKNNDSVGGIQYRFYTALRKGPISLGTKDCNLAFGGLIGNPYENPADSGLFPCIPVPGAIATNSDLHDGIEIGRTQFTLDQNGRREIKSISNNYYSSDTRWKYNDTLYNIKKIGFPGIESGFKYYSIYSVSRYMVLSDWFRLDSTVSLSFEGTTDSLKLVKRFGYTNIKHLQPTSIQQDNSKGHLLTTEFKYPTDFAGIPIYDSMISRRIVTTILEQRDFNQTTGYELSKAKMNFLGWNNNRFYLPATIQKSFNGNALQTEATIQQYDTLGNILQFTGTDGLINSIIWGYGDMYPVAKILGRTYADAVSGSGINLELLNAANASEQQISLELGKIRNLSGAVVNTYTYKPFIGVSTETDTNGRTTFYEYDPSGRLIHLKDQKGNIVKKYCYNYAGQQVNCNGSQ
jgi:YD repeat-containing protein